MQLHSQTLCHQILNVKGNVIKLLIALANVKNDISDNIRSRTTTYAITNIAKCMDPPSSRGCTVWKSFVCFFSSFLSHSRSLSTSSCGVSSPIHTTSLLIIKRAPEGKDERGGTDVGRGGAFPCACKKYHIPPCFCPTCSLQV